MAEPTNTLRDQLRRTICEADGFDFTTIEPDEYGDHADAIVTLLPEQPYVLEDGSTRPLQALLDAGESCVQRHCKAARETTQLDQAAYVMRGHVDTALDELNDLVSDGTVTADAVDTVRRALRDALGLNNP